MAAPSFRRSATWSTATAVDRIERKLGRARLRRAEIDSERTRLGVESDDLDVLIAQLDRLLEVEIAARDRNASAVKAVVPEQNPVEMPSAMDGTGAVVLSVAASHSRKREYHREGRFFLPKDRRSAGSTAVRRYQIPEEGCDRETQRLIKMIEVPGLNQHAPTRSAPVHPAEAVSVP